MGGVLGSASLGGQTAAIAPLGAVLLNILQVTIELVWSAYLDHTGALGAARVSQILPYFAYKAHDNKDTLHVKH